MLPTAIALALQPAASSARAQDPTCRITGRCVAAESGVGLARATVTVAYRHNGRPLESGHRPEPVTTTSLGAFELSLAPPDGATVCVRVTCDGRRSKEFEASAAALGASGRLDVELRRGVRVTGTLRDRRGRPVVGQVSLHVTATVEGSRPGGPSMRPDAPRSPFRVRFDGPTATARYERLYICDATVAADGTFSVDGRVPAGRAQVWVSAPGMRPTHALRYQLIDGAPRRIDVVMAALPRLTGVVVDELGEPVAGVLLRAKNNRYGPSMEAETDRHGAFTILRSGPAADRVPIVIVDPARCERHAEFGPFGWGSSALRLELERSPEVVVDVVAAEDGAPIEAFAVRSYAFDASHRQTRLRLAGRHEQGRVRVPVRRGEARLAIVPDDPRRMVTSVDVFGRDRMKPIVVRLERMAPMQVDVRSASGEPRAGVTVEVVVPGNSRHRDRCDDARGQQLRMRSRDPATRFATIVYRAETDAGGRCIVFGPAGQGPLRLRVSRSHGRRTWIDDVRIADGVREVVW